MVSHGACEDNLDESRGARIEFSKRLNPFTRELHLYIKLERAPKRQLSRGKALHP